MLTLNIIPQSSKNEIKLKNIYFYLKNLLYIIIILLILYAITLLIGVLLLQIQFVNTVNETTALSKNKKNSSLSVLDLNNQINSITSMQSESIKWTGLYKFISEDTNDDIKYYQINMSKNDNTLYLHGIAGSRDSLINLKSALEKSAYFSSVDFPIQNLLEKNNINFEITCKIASYDFKRK
jgi:Tfp pilus assembly protein PilN